MKNVLIGGIGNVLLGDDAIGPYIVSLLESSYRFGDGIEISDLGTPALDLTQRIAGRDAVILVDCVPSDDLTPGSIQLYSKQDILQLMPAQRLDPHSPALAECLMTAEMLGASPRHLLLVGIVGESFESGAPLSQAVRQAAAKAVDVVLAQLEQIGVQCYGRTSPAVPCTWWSDSPRL